VALKIICVEGQNPSDKSPAELRDALLGVGPEGAILMVVDGAPRWVMPDWVHNELSGKEGGYKDVEFYHIGKFKHHEVIRYADDTHTGLMTPQAMKRITELEKQLAELKAKLK